MNRLKRFHIYLVVFSLGLTVFILSSNYFSERGIFTFSTTSIPFPLAAEIKDEKGNIRLGLEKVIKENYYITYSKTEGNQSYLGTYVIIENLKRETLNKQDFKKIELTDNLGNKYDPLPYQEILDFPQDQPLGWKIKIFNKFPPVNRKATFINIRVIFEDKTFDLQKAPLP